MPISRANGLDIHYETAGSGPPLVLIHALPFDHNLWLYQVEAFSSSPDRDGLAWLGVLREATHAFLAARHGQ
jgi:pimeloyl-ACP methyl ester carboxylesterase